MWSRDFFRPANRTNFGLAVLGIMDSGLHKNPFGHGSFQYRMGREPLLEEEEKLNKFSNFQLKDILLKI